MTTYSTDPALYIFTSLTAGSSHIVTATSRLETILRANRVPFKAVDIAVDEKARMLWGRRAGKDASGRLRKLPGLVQEGLVLGDLVEIEDWNEYGELKQHVKIYYDEFTIPNIHNKPPEPKKTKKPAAKPAVAANTPVASKAEPPAPPAPPLPEAKPSSSSKTTTTKTKTTTTTTTTTDKTDDKPPAAGKQAALPLRSVADEAAQKAKELRLKSLREKVHGKEASIPAESSSKTTTTAPKIDISDIKEEAPDTKPKSDMKRKAKPAPLQSPASGAWENKSEQDFVPEAVQSPRSGKWRPGSLDSALNGAEPLSVPVSTEAVKAEKTTEKTKLATNDTEGSKHEEQQMKGKQSESNDDANEDSNKDTKTESPETVNTKNEDKPAGENKTESE
ncbi:hypothetical protein E4U54_004987 [Claviceps lovelessii]|nr:hypothetical protein E4U54_004987 [Claviceps lovelessii]